MILVRICKWLRDSDLGTKVSKVSKISLKKQKVKSGISYDEVRVKGAEWCSNSTIIVQ